MMRVVVLGGGESGVGAAILAKKKGLDVFLSDRGQIEFERKIELEKYNVDFEEGQHTFEKLVNADVIVKSPGIPSSIPLISKLRQNEIEIISEVEWAYRFCKSKIVAITGSNGKTTTTNLIHHIAKTAGINAAAVGNIGESMARHVASEAYDWLIVEMSSFQLEDIRKFKSDVSVILNITPDHMDRYDSIEEYALAKWNITRNHDDESHLIAVNFGILSDVIKAHDYEGQLTLIDPLDCENGHVIFQGQNWNFTNDALKGPHNAQNVACALAVAKIMSINDKVVEKALATFVNHPHRLELVVQRNGWKVINDSKATNVEAAEQALKSFTAPIVWIAGGTDKGNDYSLLKPLVQEKVKALVAMGVDNSKIISAFEKEVNTIFDCKSLEEAVERAMSLAEEGVTILLSPACASFDLFKNYIDRGDRFKKEVLKYK